MVLQELQREIDVLIRSRYPVLYIISFEEGRVEQVLRMIAGDKKRVMTWTVTQPWGITVARRGSSAAIEVAEKALDFIMQDIQHGNPTIYVLHDFHPYLDDAIVVRKLRDLANSVRYSYSTIVLVSPVLKVPETLEKEITVIDFPLPDMEELRLLLERIVRSVSKNPKVVIDLSDPHREQLVKAALGLTADEASRAFAKALVLDNRLDRVDIQVVLSEKKQILRKTGLLEYYEPDTDLADVGGLDALKEWLRKRAKAFSERARQFGLPEPRGILLLGVQGCGKSLTAKAVASLWKLPLLRFDVGAVFAKFVGESEANMRRVIKVAESLSPCILWIDELDKAFSFRQVGDAGTTARVLATLLTWLQEKTKPVFVIATANSISELPPELLRKGRFDEIFFVDLPNREERKEIFAIHLRKRNRSITAFDLEALADTSEGFSGAEIEQAIIDALYDAYDEDRELTTQDILRALESTVPLSRTMSESIEELRDWAATRARPASRRADVEAKEAEVSEAELTASVAQREQPVDAISYWERGPELD